MTMPPERVDGTEAEGAEPGDGVVGGDAHELLAEARGALARVVDAPDAHRARPVAIWSPGRIEVLGKHTDYAGGRSLLCAVERGVCVVAVPRDDARLRLHDARLSATVECELTATSAPRALAGPGAWGTYPAAVARRIARNFPGPLRGADIALASDLPAAAGMSSSSALVVAIFLALAEINALAARDEYRREIRSAEELAGYLGCVENGEDFGSLRGDAGVGTFGGSEDHTAILCGRAGALAQYAFCPVRLERVVPLPRELTFAIAVSGVAAEKTGNARERYNAASHRARTIVERWREATGRRDATLAAALSSGAAAAGALEALLARGGVDGRASRELLDRLAHFRLESEVLVPAAGDALAAGDLEALGAAVDRSQRAAEEWLGNQVPETIALARAARELGAVAASAFGAGFGGSVWALVPADGATTFLDAWRARYLARFPARASACTFFLTRAGRPAARLA
ncbi:MAG TPA: galactokinase family protein [Gemmatimonadaceae bacterium]